MSSFLLERLIARALPITYLVYVIATKYAYLPLTQPFTAKDPTRRFDADNEYITFGL
jgi:hypothetical protein